MCKKVLRKDIHQKVATRNNRLKRFACHKAKKIFRRKPLNVWKPKDS